MHVATALQQMSGFLVGASLIAIGLLGFHGTRGNLFALFCWIGIGWYWYGIGYWYILIRNVYSCVVFGIAFLLACDCVLD